jgi:hypothetical protein
MPIVANLNWLLYLPGKRCLVISSDPIVLGGLPPQL